MLQNHLLQLLALTAMEEPVEFSAEEIRDREAQGAAARSRVPEDLETFAVRGQYEQGWLAGQRVRGYRQEDGVDPKSTTETFAAVRFGVETRRWAGVPFYLRTGKRLPRRVTEIARGVQARAAPALRRHRHRGAGQQPARRPGPARRGRHPASSARRCRAASMEVRDVSMDFLYGEQFTEASPEAYERLLLDVLLGDADALPAQRRGRGRPGRSSTRSRSSGPARHPAPVPGRRVGPRGRRRDARRRGPPVAATVTPTRIRAEDTP